MPVSTTHTKTTAFMGVGAEKRMRAVKWNLAGNMVLTWVLTFPGCGLLAYGFTITSPEGAKRFAGLIRAESQYQLR